jgi:hypothetical protein
MPFRMGAPLSAACRGAAQKHRYINDIHPEITVVSKNVLWILGWRTRVNGEPFKSPFELVSKGLWAFLLGCTGIVRRITDSSRHHRTAGLMGSTLQSAIRSPIRSEWAAGTGFACTSRVYLKSAIPVTPLFTDWWPLTWNHSGRRSMQGTPPFPHI